MSDEVSRLLGLEGSKDLTDEGATLAMGMGSDESDPIDVLARSMYAPAGRSRDCLVALKSL